MRKLTFVFIIIALALLQATVLGRISIFAIKPDLLLVSVIISSLFLQPAWAVSLSVFSGVLKDIFSVNVFGINTLLFFLWSFLIIRLSREITFDSDYVRFALIFIIAILNNIIARFLLLFSGNFISWGIFFRITFVESLYTALVLLLALRLMRLLLSAG